MATATTTALCALKRNQVSGDDTPRGIGPAVSDGDGVPSNGDADGGSDVGATDK